MRNIFLNIKLPPLGVTLLLVIILTTACTEAEKKSPVEPTQEQVTTNSESESTPVAEEPTSTPVAEEPASDATAVPKNPRYEEGAALYEQHCRVCHFLRESGGDIGPSLDELAEAMDGTYMREAIVAPDRYIKEGYEAGIMPKTFNKDISENEMDALIFFITN